MRGEIIGLLFIVLVLSVKCQSRVPHSNDSELIDEGDYAEDEEIDQSDGDQTDPDQPGGDQSHVNEVPSHQRSPQSLYGPSTIPDSNKQPSLPRNPNILTPPSPSSPRWIQPIGNGLPVNPNLPNTAQRLILMPPTSTEAARASQQTTPIQSLFSTTTAVDQTVIGRPIDQFRLPSPPNALPGIPLTGAAAGQRLIVLPNGNRPVLAPPALAGQSVQSVQRPMQSQYPQGSVITSQFPERPVYQYLVSPATSKAPSIPKTTPSAGAAQKRQNQTAFRVQPTSPLDKQLGRVGVHTTHGKLLLEAHSENFCDQRQFSDDELHSKNLQRVEYFVGNLSCSRYFFACAIGQTFLLNCTSKDQVFDINTVNCNFKYNVRSCQEYDHILHCSIQEDCPQDHFACCGQPQQCIPYTKRCDGIADCGDGEDENNCPSCNADQFPCVKSGKCIAWEKRCNGVQDECYDQTNLDEQNCGGCTPGQFSCTRQSDTNPICINISLRCNGIRDCPQGEDEVNCKSKGPKYLLCENQKQSVSKDQWCDGYEDCLDGSDEKYCVY